MTSYLFEMKTGSLSVYFKLPTHHYILFYIATFYLTHNLLLASVASCVRKILRAALYDGSACMKPRSKSINK